MRHSRQGRPLQSQGSRKVTVIQSVKYPEFLGSFPAALRRVHVPGVCFQGIFTPLPGPQEAVTKLVN